MKTLLSAACIAVLASSVVAAPQISIDQAISLAQQHLKERGLDGDRYITSLALEKDSITRGNQYWYARWSESVKLEDRKTELGLRINMDGSVVRIVEGPAAQPKNYRTRSDRPSILDLKH
ncbi:hypothetical protein ACXR0O_18465 [Verrucomicrobiota bacterium sgz303538]